MQFHGREDGVGEGEVAIPRRGRFLLLSQLFGPGDRHRLTLTAPGVTNHRYDFPFRIFGRFSRRRLIATAIARMGILVTQLLADRTRSTYEICGIC